MQVRFANRDEFAWGKGEGAYEPGDSLEIGVAKAEQAGFRPGCNGYSAFITAFSRRIRQYQDSSRGQPAQAGQEAKRAANDSMQTAKRAANEGLQVAAN
ncbi:MAG: hypothetical protein JWP36_1720 [Paucimonas sp.]|jgi:hypothetical protein|nr:hypothetical protein [Paucimonas sp.]